MMDLKLPNTRSLKLKDFTEDEEGNFNYEDGNYRLTFYQSYSSKPKMYVQVWYIEKKKSYLIEEKIIDWKPTKNKFVIRERNKEMWNTINNFYQRYF